MHLNLIQIAGIISISQALLMVLFLVEGNERKTASRFFFPLILIIFVFIIGANLSINFRIKLRYHKYIWLIHQLSLLTAPLLYFYVKSLLDNTLKFRLKQLLHIVPFLIMFFYGVASLLFVKKASVWLYPGRVAWTITYLIQNAVYLFAIGDLLKQQGLSFRMFFSYIKDFKMAWIRFLIIGFIIFWLIQFQTFMLWDVLRIIRWCPYHISLYSLTAFVFLNAIVYLALKKPEIFRMSQKYVSSTLSAPLKMDYQVQLMAIMEKDKLYLDPALNLIRLARKLFIAPCHLSQVINESFGLNFRDFINRYRVQESKQYLIRNIHQRKSILEIAYEVGFNSKSSFNAAFKKHFGITPKEFRQQTNHELTLN
jgi:AraC-like DNA-binding protein